MNRSFLHRHAFALSAVCLTLVLRLLTLAQLSSSPYALPVTSDMKFYADWALRIARGEWSDGHAFYGQPLYAYLVGGIFAVVGYQPFWIGLLQALCDTAIALLIFKIATLVFAELPARRAALIGLLAAVGWAFYVPAAAYSGLLIPTSFVVAIWAFALWWILQRSATARWAECFGIAALVGLSALIAAATLFILPLLAVALFLKRRQLLFIALLAGLLAGTAPAWTHNLLVAHDPVFISAHGGLNFWIGNNPDANGYPKIPPGLPSDQAQLLESSIRIAETAAGHSLPRSEVSAFWSHKASAYIQANPAAWLGLVGVKLRNFWNAFRYDDLSSITPLRDAGIVLPGLHFGLLAALGLPGALFAFRNRRARWIIAALGLQMLALLPAFVNERYRLPAVPGLLILASYFLFELWERVRVFHWPKLATAGAALIASTIFVSLPPTDPALRSVDDFKAGRRELIANDFALAEKRLRLAAAAAVAPPMINSLVANLFAEEAREKWKNGDRANAVATMAEAERINPADENLRRAATAMQTGLLPAR